ncbi:hypothetical protein CT676_37430 [Bradyrhizobium sp. MOS001]|uniref:hypothetical protein n=1 Tax=unclassified Bradyrhizobium TaxID=2631580 RepID=UPI00107585AE|nr:hypothetical protein [Bradyrhizobium sp. MOS001]TFW55997.1 hypothetical protein CT676_37430 [Bradyrhizobium sp. MOS001]
MTDEIIEFPLRKHEDRLVSAVIRLGELVREVERLADEQPADDLHRLLNVMERFVNKLVESSSLLLDEDAQGRVQTAFTSLSGKITETREAMDELRRHP